MPLPPLNSEGELPEGVHHATTNEVLTQFGGSTPQRQDVTARLQRIYQLARATGKLTRLVIFGSYVTTKPHPNDVDVILVMADDFRLHAFDAETLYFSIIRRRRRSLGQVSSGFVPLYSSWRRWRPSLPTGRSRAMGP